MTMGMFKPAENTMAFLKAGFMGEAGTGKTHTATLLAIGLIKLLKQRGMPHGDKPAMMLDTENGSSWIKPMFDEAGIPLLVAKTRAFVDLVPAIREAEKEASVLLIDSVTHFWQELQTTYMTTLSQRRRRQITALEFQDWNYIKREWSQFSDAFVVSNLHCILCGRLGWEYEQTKDENNRKQIERSGAKMQAEKGLGYEPNILVWMEKDMDLATKSVTRNAIVLKDRSRRLDGKQFENPTFQTFLPHIEFMALGGRHEAADVNRTSDALMPEPDGPRGDMKHIQRRIVLDEIMALMVKHHPSTAQADKAAKAALLEKHFGTTSWTRVEELMPLVELQKCFDTLHQQLEGKPSHYGVQLAPPPPIDDEIPCEQAALDVLARENEANKLRKEVKAEAEDPGPSFTDKALSDLDNRFRNAHNETRIRQAWKNFGEVYEALDEDGQAKAKRRLNEALARVAAAKAA